MARRQQLDWKHRLYGWGHRGLGRAGLGRWLDYRCCEVLHTTTPPLTVSGWDADTFAVSEAGAGDEAWLRTLGPRPEVDFAARWQGGCRCFAAALTESGVRRCVGYVWIASGPHRLAGPRGWDWAIPAGSAWIFDALTHPLVPGTYPDLICATNAQLVREGISSLLGQVEFDNRTSRRVHRALSGRRLGWIASLYCAGLSLHLDRRRGACRLRWGRAPVRLDRFLDQPMLAPSPPPQTAGAARQPAP